MKSTLSYDEYELVKYDLCKLHNTLATIGAAIDNERVQQSVWEAKYAIKSLLDVLRTQDIIL